MSCSRVLLLTAIVLGALAGPAAARDISWSGYEWHVRDEGPSGPGPNHWSGSPSSVWVDSNGHLHLKVRFDPELGRWVSAEVVSRSWFGPGRYTWVVDSPGDGLDRNVTLGMYNYLDPLHEIDIELARWGQPREREATNAQYVVQPWWLPGNQTRFAAPAGPTTYSFDRRSDSIWFNGSSGTWAKAWLYRGLTGGGGWKAPARINLWQFEGRAPAGGAPVEVVLRSFGYDPPAG